MMESSKLEFDGVCLEPGLNGLPCRNMSIALGPGDVVFVQTDHVAAGALACDAAQGLVAPVQGRVLFLGRSWDDTGPAETAALRGRIGRVFSGPAWVSNLSVRENIVLSTVHHTGIHGAALAPALETLLRASGLAELPGGRVDAVRGDILQRLQWVRAFLARPDLVLLEQPAEGLTPGDTDRLADIVMRASGEGTAILWIERQRPQSRILSFTSMHALRNGTLMPLEEGRE